MRGMAIYLFQILPKHIHFSLNLWQGEIHFSW